MSVLSKPIPEDHLLAIFGQVSLKTLVRLPLVCTHWSSLHPTACRQTHTLTLCLDEPILIENSLAPQLQIRKFPPFKLHFPSLTTGLSLSFPIFFRHSNGRLPRTLLTTLHTLFPFIRTLKLEIHFFFSNTVLSPEESLSSLGSLLRGWTRSLTSLSVYGFQANPPWIYNLKNDQSYLAQLRSSSDLRSFLSTINTLPNLKRLTLDVDNYFLPEENFHKTGFEPIFPSTIRFSILSRLQFFSLKCHDNYRFLLPSLRTYASSNPVLPEIHIGDADSSELITLLIDEGSPLLSSFRQFHYCDGRTFPETAFIGVHLRHLTTLSLHLSSADRHTVCGLAQTLLNCTTLRTLSLFFLRLESVQLGVSQHSDLPALPAVTSLFLKVSYLSSHQVLAHRLPLGRLFPNLAVFQTNHFMALRCTVCDFDYQIDFSYSGCLTDEQRIVQGRCIHLMVREALKGCVKLRKIVLEGWDNSVAVYDELPEIL